MILRDKLKQQFDLEYARLNDNQRQAVDRIDGPVMVIAGPGTGKTQILAARIGKILLETDASPSNIICLTYTDAGALAMRRRLIHFIGSDAYKVNIYTFHAFCNDIIQENLSYFEKQELDPISELEKIELMQELIDAFPKDHPLKRYRSDAYWETSRLLNLFSTMKQEGWSPDYILKCIEEYLADLPNRPAYIAKKASGSFKKGDLRTDWIARDTEPMLKLAAGVKEYPKFQSLMHRNNRYDFDDMINWVIQSFQENETLLRNYQERFQYVLVDEYQDTSGSQNKLVQLLINFWEKPNVFVVGDDDQSIYRFQGANVENMERFVTSYSTDLFKVVLTHNYRSTQPILDISKTLISKNEERLISKMEGLTKNLVSSHPEFSLLMHPPVIREYESQRQEMIGITLEVEKLIEAGTEAGKIAVIFKENIYGEELGKLFRFRNIPAYSKRSLNLFDIPLAQKILAIFDYISAELDAPYGGDEMLFRILHSSFFNIPPIEIAKLSVEVAERQFSDRRTSIRRLLHERATMPPRDLFDAGIHPNLKKAGEVMEQLISDTLNMTLQSLLENIIRNTGILAQIMQGNEKIWNLQVLTALFDFVKDETRRKPDITLAEFMRTIQQMEENRIRIPLVQIGGTDKGVNLLTAHGSKGLEFEHVFFAGCNAKLWEKKRSPNSSFAIPDTVFSSKPLASDHEELRRLFYVAITRAQTNLYISYANFDNAGKGLEPTQFIEEIRDEHEHQIEKVHLQAELMADFQAQLFIDTAAPEIAQLESDFITRLLEKFVMSVTALNTYLKCPLEFYFKNLIRIPSPKNEHAAFGSAVHYAIQRFFEVMKDDPKEQFPTKNQLIGFFEWHMRRNRESFLKEAFDRRTEYGHKILSDYYDEYIHQWNKVVVLERNIRNVVISGVPVKGKLDKLEFNNKQVNVVDYKTGNTDKRMKKLHRPNTDDPNGGDYWRQAVFYKLLVDNAGQSGWVATSVEFDFIEPDSKKGYVKEKLVITSEEIDIVTRQITDTWHKIQNRQFYTGCGKPDCDYCNFIKTNELYTHLHEIEEEDEIPANA